MATHQIKERLMAPQTQQALKMGGDASAIGALAGWFVGILPTIATLFTVIWFAILITEKVTGRPFAELVRCAWSKIRRS